MSILKYFSFIKFSHTLFAMPFAMIGFFMGVKSSGYTIDWKLFLFVVLCMIFARNAAMGFNSYLDRSIDKKNKRTSMREVPAGLISERAVITFIIINSVLFCLSAYFINYLTFILSPVALIVILGYSYTKQFTALCHFILGLGLALAPIGAYISVTAEFHLIPVIFSLIVLFWVSGFDILYALQDEDFDRKENLKSIPVLIGRKLSLYLSSLLHLIVVALLFISGYIGEFGLFYWIGTALFVALLFYQHVIIKPKDISRLNIAFFTTNGIASVLFGIAVIVDILMNKA